MTIDPAYQPPPFEQRPPFEPEPSMVDEIRQAGDRMHQAAGAAADAFVPPTVRRHMRAAVRHLFAAGVAAMDSLESRAQYYEQRRASPPPPPVTPTSASTASAVPDSF